MANFPPFQHHIYYCLEQLIIRHGLTDPFLDVGCGIGDVSHFVAQRGWKGKAIDFSAAAISEATQLLSSFDVNVTCQDVYDEQGHFNTILCTDVIEHIEDDQSALNKMGALLNEGGHAVYAVPSNPVEWRWDDEFYGHFRRYTLDEFQQKLANAGMTIVTAWDCSFPVFWLLRRVYTRLKSGNGQVGDDKIGATKASAMHNSWEMPIVAALISNPKFGWPLIYKLQFKLCGGSVRLGHEMIVLAQKSPSS